MPAQRARSQRGGDELVGPTWVRHPTDDGGGSVLVEIKAVDTAGRVYRGIQIRCPVVLQRHDPYAHPTLDQLDFREMRDLARQLRRVVVRRGVAGDAVRRHREVRRIRARQKGRIRRLGPPGRRDRAHGDPADQPDQEGDGQIARPAAAEGGPEAIPGNGQHAVFTPRRLSIRDITLKCCACPICGQGWQHPIALVPAPRLQGRWAVWALDVGGLASATPSLGDTKSSNEEGGGAPPTAFTISRESPWRWRDSNRGSRFSKSARQRHRFESTCHFGETERYSLVLVGTHWHSLVRAACVLFVPHRGKAFRTRLCSARKRHRGCPIPALIFSPIEGVFDVVSVCFSLRRGRVIASGALDAFDVATAVADDANTCSLSVGSDERPTGGDAGQ